MCIYSLQEVDLATEAYLVSDSLRELEWAECIEDAINSASLRYVKVVDSRGAFMYVLNTVV
jgi:hypothetical protein